MKEKKKKFEQYFSHEIEIESEEEVEKYLEEALPLIGDVVMFFNGLEKSLDRIICEIFTDRTDAIGLIVLHKMSYSSKVDLFKRFSDDFHFSGDCKIEIYDELILNLRETGRLRNLVVHADWEKTDTEGYTYVNLKISKSGMEQEYLQFDSNSLKKIVLLIIKTRTQLSNYWDERNEKLYS